MNHAHLFEEARRYLAGGVNSPVRAFRSVGGAPLFARRGSGKYLYCEDGRRMLDYCLSWGPLILGHAHPEVCAAVAAAAHNGATFGVPTRAETELAALIIAAFPSIERLRLVNSGTEAVMSALRVARGYTGRKMLLKFDGCYHGHVDALLVRAGSGVAELPQASSNGVPDALARLTVSVPFNDAATFTRMIAQHQDEIAAVILEPVPGNMGLVVPDPAFLHTVRELTLRHGIVLIFDEVICGFRLGYGGAQHRFGLVPDMTILGKIIGGGLPVGAFGGRKELMDCLAPAGDVYQAGTLSGNPIAVAAGLATLRWLERHPRTFTDLEHLVAQFAQQWRQHSPHTINAIGSLFSIFHTTRPVRNYADACAQDLDAFAKTYQQWLARDVFMPPAPFETAFVSILHTPEDLQHLLVA
jgi:glutamate-1-semialdehyde 2,1-aminomutase